MLLHPTCRLLKCKRELQTVQFALIPRAKISSHSWISVCWRFVCSCSQKGRCEFEMCTENLAPRVVFGVYTPQEWLGPQNAEDTIDKLNFLRLLLSSVH